MSKIKYDKQQQRLTICAATFCTILTVLAALMVHLPDSPLDRVSDYAAVFVMCAYMFLPVVSLALWVCALDTHFYFRRLMRHGYEIPDRKSVCHGSLSELPHDEKNEYDSHIEIRESKILSIISGVIGCVMVCESVLLAIRFQKLGSDAWLFDVCMFVVYVCWFMTALVYRRQMRTDLYRDDVAIDTSGKVRQNIVMGMLSIVLGVFASEIIFYMIYKAADFILRARG